MLNYWEHLRNKTLKNWMIHYCWIKDQCFSNHSNKKKTLEICFIFAPYYIFLYDDREGRSLGNGLFWNIWTCLLYWVADVEPHRGNGVISKQQKEEGRVEHPVGHHELEILRMIKENSWTKTNQRWTDYPISRPDLTSFKHPVYAWHCIHFRRPR